MSISSPSKVSINFSRRYVPWFWLLTGLFCIRVIAQPSALLINSRFLPAFESWHGGVLPYPILLITQLLILLWMIRTTRKFETCTVLASYRIGVNVLIIASIYFIVMFARLILGITIFSEIRWFASPLPAFFHMVLASFLLFYGHFHFRYGRGPVR